jgi:hypothetical protein
VTGGRGPLFMKNFDLNAGGVIGAIACIVVALTIVFLIDVEDKGRFGKVIIVAAIAGGVGGNFLWEQIQNTRRPK